MNHERLMELALVLSVPDQNIDSMRPSRLRGKYMQLRDVIYKDLLKTVNPAPADIDKIWKKIDRFGRETGWLHETRHVGTIFSLCAEMLENSKHPHNPRILEIVNEVIEHLEAGGHLKTACCWAGGRAAEIWEGLKVKS